MSLYIAGCVRNVIGVMRTQVKVKGTLTTRRSISSICRPRYTLGSVQPSSQVTASLSSAPGFVTRYIHTAGDADLVQFLKDEIKTEKENESAAGKLPKLKGFELTSSDGPNVVLTQKKDNETIVIKLNVNHSVDEDISEVGEAEHPEGKASKMVSKPSFIVEINKGSGKTLAIACIFPSLDDMPPPDQEGQEHYDDLIEIEEITLLDKSQEWNDNIYSLSGAVMDGNMYDMLLRMLEERGINAEFIQQLIDFSTAYEHQKYIGLLEQLRTFVVAK